MQLRMNMFCGGDGAVMINYGKLINPKVQSMAPSGIRKFFDIAEKMNDVISLGVGEPDFATPMQARRAAINALENGKTKYTSNRGTSELRFEISRYLSRRFSVDYDSESELLVTVGGSEAIDVAVRAIISEGDEVIIPEPSYVCYLPMVLLSGGKSVIINTKSENGFKLTPDELRAAITPRTKLLILPYPSNPTGAVMMRSDIEALYEVLRDTDILVISDEIYAELVYDGEYASVPAVQGMRERTVLVGGFSKTYAMTGWRLGYAAAPAPICSAMTKIHQYCIMCAPTVSQSAAAVALRECDFDVMRMRSEYSRRRDIIVDGFNSIGLDCRSPEGTFYAFPSIKRTGLTSEEFCERLLCDARVALVPGTAFGKSGEGYVRASFCYSDNHISEALFRIEKFLKEI